MTSVSILDILKQSSYLYEVTNIMDIKELRLLSGLSQRKFADKYNINFRTIQNWEQGISETPPYVLETLFRLITELDYKETFVQDVCGEEYNITGKLFLLKDGKYYITFYHDKKLYSRILVDKRYIKDQFRDDYAWMSLEDAYEDVIINGG